MGRHFAGILGTLAMLTALARGALGGFSVETILWQAWCGLVIYAPAGFVLGGIAGRVVEDAFSALVEQELAEGDIATERTAETAESPEK